MAGGLPKEFQGVLLTEKKDGVVRMAVEDLSVWSSRDGSARK